GGDTRRPAASKGVQDDTIGWRDETHEVSHELGRLDGWVGVAFAAIRLGSFGDVKKPGCAACVRITVLRIVLAGNTFAGSVTSFEKSYLAAVGRFVFCTRTDPTLFVQRGRCFLIEDEVGGE